MTVDHRAALIGPILLGGVGVVATLYAAVAAGDSGPGGLANPYLVLAGGAGITVALVWSAVRRIAGKTRATVEQLIEAIGESSDRERAS